VKIHPHDLLLEKFASTLLRDDRSIAEHLRECRRCRERVSALKERPLGPTPEKLAEVLPWTGTPDARYRLAFEAAETRLLSHIRVLSAERAEAPMQVAELMKQPPERREMLMRNHPRFQTWGLLERLIEHAREQCFSDPLSAESLARLALCLADSLEVGYYGAERIEDLRAQAWGYVGNARRIQFELQGAEEAFKKAFAHLRQGTGDVLERALLLDLRASLLRAQRRFAASERLLLRVLRIYRKVGETHRVGRTLVSMTALYEQAGTPERSIPLLHEALGLIDAEREPRLLWSAHHNLVTALTETGRLMEAQGQFIRARPLYDRFPDGYTQNRRCWVAGRIARGLGQIQKAEAHLQEARAGFIAAGAAYSTALVSLDLAALYAERGRMAELKRISEEMFIIFSSRQIHREALAALAFLRQASAAEELSH
jgi:tetratricopeptide (TPR) repeat protein